MVKNWEDDPKDWVLDYDQMWTVSADRLYWYDASDPPQGLQLSLTDGEVDTAKGGIDIEW